MGEKGPPPTSLSGLLFSFIAGLFFLADGLIIQISSVASIDLIFWICAVQLIVLFPIIHYRHHNGNSLLNCLLDKFLTFFQPKAVRNITNTILVLK